MAITTTTEWAEYVQEAFDTTVGYYLRDEPVWRRLVDKRPVSQAMPGQPVTLTIDGQLDDAITPLSEATDPAPTTLADPRQLQVTLAEYGSHAVTTMFLEKLDFTSATLKRKAKQIADNQVDSIDLLVRNVADGADNVLFSTSATGPGDRTGPASEDFNQYNVAAATTSLQFRNSRPRQAELYTAIIHPDVAFDLRLATGENSWSAPHTYVDTKEIYNGEVGSFHGARFVVSRRCTVTPDGGGAGIDTYNTYFFGQEALVEVVSVEPKVVIGPVVDPFKRRATLGWYGMLGHAIYRNNSIEIVESTSSLQDLNSAYDPKA